MMRKETSRRDVLKITGLSFVAGGALLASGVSVAEAKTVSVPIGRNRVYTYDVQSLSNSASLSFTTHSLPEHPLYLRSMARVYNDYNEFYAAGISVEKNKNALLFIERVVGGKATLLDMVRLPYNLIPGRRYELSFSARGTQRVDLIASIKGDNTENTLSYTDSSDAKIARGTMVGYGVYLSSKNNRGLILDSNITRNTFDQPAGERYVQGFGYPIFEDDFDKGLNTKAWNVYDKTYLSYDWGYITKENVTVENGNMTLSANKMDRPIVYDDGKERYWSTSYVRSQPWLSIENGRWEMRAKLPASEGVSAGFWTGFWLRTDNKDYKGEIDIAESYGSNNALTQTNFLVHDLTEGTVHFDQSGGNKKNQMIPSKGQKLEDEYHVWAAEKTPEGVRFFYDGELYHEVLVKDNPQYLKAFPLGEKLHLRLNFQMGSNYWGLPDENSKLDPKFIIDYIRIWEYKG